MATPTEKLLILTASTALLTLNTSADFAGGTGSSNNPYQISTCQQLQNMQNDQFSYYELVNDIDCSGFNNFNSIDNAPYVLDGQGYVVKNLEISEGSSNKVGLFERADRDAEIKNIGLVNADITGNKIVGGLVGESFGSVSKSYVTGSVSGSADFVGGLIGESFGSVSKSYVTGSVSGSNYVGGLAGTNWGSISSSYSSSGVSGASHVGGFVGRNGRFDTSSSVSNSYATGSVSGSDNVGGFVGRNYQSISSSYSTGSVSGSDNVGGFGGVNFDSESVVSNSYWDKQSSGTSSAWHYQGGSSDLTSLTTSEMQGSSAESNMNNLDFSNNWRVNEHAFDGAGYPQLSWQTYAGSSSNPYQISTCQQLQDMQNDLTANYELVNDVDCSGYSGFSSVGDPSNPFQGVLDGQGYVVQKLTINEGGNIGLIGYAGSDGAVKDVGLVNVDVSGNTNVGGLVGYNNGGNISGSYTTGSVDGNSNNLGGLVGYNDGGNISDSFSFTDVTGEVPPSGQISPSSRYVGGLVGYNIEGVVSGSHTHGSVFSHEKVGGLVGRNNDGVVFGSYSNATVSIIPYAGGAGGGGLVGKNGGSVSESYATGNVSGVAVVGGLVGSGGSISSSYSTGDVSGGFFVGGLAGKAGSSISSSFSAGSVSSDGAGTDVGGFVGDGSFRDISSSYWNEETAGRSYAGVGGGSVTGLSTSEMQGGTALCDGKMSGLDFEDTWFTRSGDYPGLKVFETETNPSEVNCVPSASMTVPNVVSVDIGESVTFDASGSSDPNGDSLSYSWSGDVSGSGSSISKSFDSSGNKTATVTVSDGRGGSDSVTKSVIVNEPPNASFSFTPSNPVTGENITFDASGSSDPSGDSLEYGWGSDFEVIDSMSEFEGTKTYDLSDYPGYVRLIVGNHQTGYLCQYVQWTVRIDDIRDFAYYPRTGQNYIDTGENTLSGWSGSTGYSLSYAKATGDGACSRPGDGIGIPLGRNPGQVTLDLDTSTQDYYNFKEGKVQVGVSYSDQNGSVINRSFSSPGTKSVTLTVNDGLGGHDSVTKSIFVENRPPDASFSFTPSNPEPGESVIFNASDSNDVGGTISSYSWDFGDGSTSSNQNPSHTYDENDAYTVTLTVTDNDGASSTVSRDVYVIEDKIFRRAEIEVPDRYTTISTTTGNKKSLTFTITNPSTRQKDLNVSLNGINASFETTTQTPTKKQVDINSGNEKQFRAVVQPQTPGNKQLTINATNTNTLLNNKRTIPINNQQPTTNNPTNNPNPNNNQQPTTNPNPNPNNNQQNTNTRQIPGITTLYMLVLAAGALFFFWFS